ncbi:MAG: Uma2 family endonuclease, partial [Anaerolineae bacterium]|nr:Uma2 family endonuclease [Anaerolineae bacterium]MDW8172154.1 Uma2 family endonuclease [Anaerolineae bacterium]
MQQLAQLSHADYERFLALPENAGRRLELINGEVIETMPTFLHGEITGLIFMLIREYLLQNPLGRVAVEARYRPTDGSANDFIPDVSFIRDATRIPPDGPILGMPDLAVEILSP